MCILLKLYYAKFGVSSLFSSKSYRRKTFGGRIDPPLLGKGRVKEKVSLSAGEPIRRRLIGGDIWYMQCTYQLFPPQ